MKKRPLMYFTFIYVLGIFLGSFLDLWILGPLAFAAVSLILLFLFKKSGTFLLPAAFIVIFLFGAIHCYYYLHKSFSGIGQLNNSEITFKAKIISEPDIRANKVNYIIVPSQINDDGFNKTRLLLSIYDTSQASSSYSYGDLITGTGKLILPSSARNNGGFNYKRYLASQSIYASVSSFPASIQYIGKAKLNPVIYASQNIKNRIDKVIDLSLPPQHAGLLKGILIGEKNGLSQELENDFSISGLTHILCVSGANIAYVAFCCLYFLGIFRLKKPWSNIITIMVLIIFTFITGCSPSVLRAALMGIMLLLAEILSRKTDVLTSISAACLIILLHNPLTIYDIGFQLSFAGTLGIVLFYKSISSYLTFLPKAINDVLSVTLAAQIAVTPIIALYFNKVSIIAIVSNIFVVPITGVITTLGFIVSVIGQISLFAAGLVSGINYFLLSFIIWVAKLSSSIPYASIQVITPSMIFMAFYYALAFVLLWYIPEKKPGPAFHKGFSLFCSAFIILFFVNAFIPKPFTVSFIDVGQGDCCFIKNSSGQTCLIDGGGTYPGSRTSIKPENIVIPFLLDNGVSSLDLAILSHPHGDHIEGLIKVAEKLKIRTLIIGPQFEKSSDLEKLLQICSSKKTKVITASHGDRINFGKAEFKALYPDSTANVIPSDNLNNDSLVLKLSYLNTKILFTGDIQSEAEEKLIRSGENLKSDILKVAHHGSSGSSSIEFIKAVSPSVSIIDVGKNNFGHPSDLVINKLNQVGSKIFRTDKNGQITININKNGYKVIPTLY